jgi:hypothetical protein
MMWTHSFPRLALPALALAGLCAISPGALAQPDRDRGPAGPRMQRPDHPPQARGMQGHPMKQRASRAMLRARQAVRGILRDMNLEKDQYEDIRENVKELRSERRGWFEDNGQAVGELRQQIRQAHRDRDFEQLSDLYDELAELTEDRPGKAAALDAIRDELTDAQRDTFDNRLQALKDRAKARQGRGFKRGGPGHAPQSRRGARGDRPGQGMPHMGPRHPRGQRGYHKPAPRQGQHWQGRSPRGPQMQGRPHHRFPDGGRSAQPYAGRRGFPDGARQANPRWNRRWDRGDRFDRRGWRDDRWQDDGNRYDDDRR